jgi:hypothetical protein
MSVNMNIRFTFDIELCKESFWINHIHGCGGKILPSVTESDSRQEAVVRAERLGGKLKTSFSKQYHVTNR